MGSLLKCVAIKCGRGYLVLLVSYLFTSCELGFSELKASPQEFETPSEGNLEEPLLGEEQLASILEQFHFNSGCLLVTPKSPVVFQYHSSPLQHAESIAGAYFSNSIAPYFSYPSSTPNAVSYIGGSYFELNSPDSKSISLVYVDSLEEVITVPYFIEDYSIASFTLPYGANYIKPHDNTFTSVEVIPQKDENGKPLYYFARPTLAGHSVAIVRLKGDDTVWLYSYPLAEGVALQSMVYIENDNGEFISQCTFSKSGEEGPYGEFPY